MQPLLRRRIQLVARHVVTHVVPAVVRKPQLAGLRMPVEADRVAHAAGEHLEPRAIRLHAKNRRVARIVLFLVADIARAADRYVEQTVRSKGDELLPVMRVFRQCVVHDDRLARRLEPRLDVVELHDAVDLAHVESAIAERDAARLVQPLGNGDDLIGLVVAVLIDHGVDRVAGGLVAAANEDGAFAAEGHLAGIGDAGGKQLDLEPGRHLDLLERQARRGRGLRHHACRGRRGLYPGNPDSGDRQGQGEGNEGRLAHPEMVIRPVFPRQL